VTNLSLRVDGRTTETKVRRKKLVKKANMAISMARRKEVPGGTIKIHLSLSLFLDSIIRRTTTVVTETEVVVCLALALAKLALEVDTSRKSSCSLMTPVVRFQATQPALTGSNLKF